MRFEGTSSYVATDDLKLAVNAAITLHCSYPVTVLHHWSSVVGAFTMTTLDQYG